MHEMNISDAFIYLIPAILIIIGMTLTLSYSFWKYHQKKAIKRKMQRDYLEVYFVTKRPRIGALRCNTHFTTWTDMAQSLSNSDFRRMSLYYTKQNVSENTRNQRCDVNTYLDDRYTSGLGPMIEISYISDNESLHSSIPDEKYKRNSYYEDRGLPPVPTNNAYRINPTKKEERRLSLFSAGYSFLPTLAKSGKIDTDSELRNRKSPIRGSPRKLGSLEEGHWEEACSRHLKKRKHILKQPKYARTLSSKHQFDCKFSGPDPDFNYDRQPMKAVELDIDGSSGNSDHYVFNEKSKGGEKTIPCERTNEFHNKYSLHECSTIMDTKHNIKESALVWVNLNDVPQSSV